MEDEKKEQDFSVGNFQRFVIYDIAQEDVQRLITYAKENANNKASVAIRQLLDNNDVLCHLIRLENRIAKLESILGQLVEMEPTEKEIVEGDKKDKEKDEEVVKVFGGGSENEQV